MLPEMFSRAKDCAPRPPTAEFIADRMPMLVSLTIYKVVGRTHGRCRRKGNGRANSVSILFRLFSGRSILPLVNGRLTGRQAWVIPAKAAGTIWVITAPAGVRMPAITSDTDGRRRSMKGSGRQTSIAAMPRRAVSSR